MLEIQIIVGRKDRNKTKINKGKMWIIVVYTNVDTAHTISCSSCSLAIFKSTVDLEILHNLFILDYNQIPIEIYIFTMTS